MLYKWFLFADAIYRTLHIYPLCGEYNQNPYQILYNTTSISVSLAV